MTHRPAILLLLCAAAACAAMPGGVPAGAIPEGVVVPVFHAFQRMYNFDFEGAHRILDQHLADHPDEVLAHTARGAAFLFYELDRMGVLEGEFVVNDKKLVDERKRVEPDPRVRKRFFRALDEVERLAGPKLAANPADTSALFALCLNEGMRTDYTAFVEKKQLRSLSSAKKAQSHAVRLIKADPHFVDAYMTTGVSEYLVGSLPFFVRWFVRFEEVKGSKAAAVANLEKVAASGRYLGPFARILLAIIHLREKRPQQSIELLRALARDFPENSLIRRELAVLNRKYNNHPAAEE